MAGVEDVLRATHMFASSRTSLVLMPGTSGKEPTRRFRYDGDSRHFLRDSRELPRATYTELQQTKLQPNLRHTMPPPNIDRAIVTIDGMSKPTISRIRCGRREPINCAEKDSQ